MSLVVVMRFLTLGSTPSMPNQPPKIISTGNAFLTSKKMISKFPQMEYFLDFSFSWMRVHVCLSFMFWPYSGDCGLDITKWHRTAQRIIFWMLCRWEEHRWVTYFPSQPCTAIPPRGARTKDWWEGGRGRRWQGRVRWAAAKEKNT